MTLETIIQELGKYPGITVAITGSDLSLSTPKKITFEEWAWRWAVSYKQGIVKDNTYFDSIERPLRLHLVPHFGSMALDEILPVHVHDYFKLLTDRYTLETQHKLKVCMHGLFDAAIENRLCTVNPVSRSLKLTSHVEPHIKKTWRLDQYQTAWDFARSHKYGLTIMVLMETGLLRSEMLGLEARDFNAKQHILRVRNGLVPAKRVASGKVETMHQGLKNRYRKRDIPISEELSAAISSIPRKIYVGGNVAKGVPPTPVVPAFLFYSPMGKAWAPLNWYHRRYIPFMKDLHARHPSIPILSPHELRHTRASLLKEQGVGLYDIQRLLGHRDLTMLSRRYLHTDVEELRENLQLRKKESDA